MAIAQGLFKKDGPSQALQRRELVIQIRELFNQLREGDRDILILRKIEGLSNSEAAEALGIEADAARKRLGRAVARLTVLVNENGIRLE